MRKETTQVGTSAAAALAILLFALGGCTDSSHDDDDNDAEPSARGFGDSGAGRDAQMPVPGADTDVPAPGDDAGGAGADATPVDEPDADPSMGGADATPIDRPDAAPPENCPPAVTGRVGVHVRDVNGDPLEPGDALEITIEVTSDAPSDTPVWLAVQHANVQVADDVQIIVAGAAGVGAMVTRDAGNLSISLPRMAQAGLTYTGTVGDRDALIGVFASIQRTEDGCVNPRGRSGALLQLIGGHTKTPLCVDFGEFTSLQIAPGVPLHNTAAYREANGGRQDLIADEFIFCPQVPTIVHTAEFCAVHRPGIRVALAGHHRADATWEVDDFALIEALRGDSLLGDGITSQHHNGGDTFWCGEIATLMCTEGCTAELRRDDTPIDVIAVAEAEGDRARQHDDGTVRFDALLPDDEVPFELRITALDVGVEGTIAPGLFIVIEQE